MGDRIRMARESKGWDQHDLAEALGVEPPTVSRWENNIHTPKARMIPRIAEVLNRTPDWFQAPDLDRQFVELDRMAEEMEALKAHLGMPLKKSNHLVTSASRDESELLRLFRQAAQLGEGRAVLDAVRNTVRAASGAKKAKTGSRG